MVKNTRDKKVWIFPCFQWLSLFEDDCQIKRQLQANSSTSKLPAKTGLLFKSLRDINQRDDFWASLKLREIFLSNIFSNFFLQFFLSKFSLKFFLRIFSQNFFSKFFCQNFPKKFFLRIFVKFFFKIFCQNFPQNIFGICFEGFARETHACCEHPTRDFSRDYINENFFVKFFFPNFFFPNFFKIFLKIFS